MTKMVRYLAVLVAGVIIGLSAWAQEDPPKKPERTKEQVLTKLKEHRAAAEQKIQMAIRRIGEKNFLAARSAAADAAEASKRLRETLPWQPMFHQFDVAVDAMRTSSWGNAKDAIDEAAEDLEFLANFMDVKPVRPNLDKCKEAMNEHNMDLARQRIRKVKDQVAVEEIADPLRQTQAFLKKARKNLTSMPLFIKGKRKEAKKNLERGRAQLESVWPKIEDYMAGKMKEKPPTP